MADRCWIIYALCEPGSAEVRYVGVTHRSHRTRLAEHVSAARRGRSHRACWLRSLGSARPEVLLLEEGQGPNWAAAEQRWIARYRGAGARLVNATDGGEGTLGRAPSAEERAAAAERAKRVHTGAKRSPETRARMSNAHHARLEQKRRTTGEVGKQTPSTTTTREKLAAAIARRPEEQRRAFAQNQVGKAKSPEHRQRIAEGQRTAWARRKGVQ